MADSVQNKRLILLTLWEGIEIALRQFHDAPDVSGY